MFHHFHVFAQNCVQAPERKTLASYTNKSTAVVVTGGRNSRGFSDIFKANFTGEVKFHAEIHVNFHKTDFTKKMRFSTFFLLFPESPHLKNL